MGLVAFADTELRAAGFLGKDGPYDGMIGSAVLKLVEAFADQNHSGGSAGITVSLFERLARYEPLGPITGEADEWTEVSDGLFQNRRCSHVFKDADGKAYDIYGRIFREPSGCCFTNRDSRVYVTFPYTPTREYVDVPERSDG